jgi:hypothetical protein
MIQRLWEEWVKRWRELEEYRLAWAWVWVSVPMQLNKEPK